MRRVGPQPPDPDWDRMDLRGPNGTRSAWGYISPEDEVLVRNDGRVYVLVDRDGLIGGPSEGGTVRLERRLMAIVRRCLRWAGIVNKIYTFVDDETEALATDAEDLVRRNRVE